MISIVVDTCSVVSGVISTDSASAYLLNGCQQGEIELITSPPLIAELAGVLHRPKVKRRHHLTEEQVEAVLRYLSAIGTPVWIEVDVPTISRAPKDDPVILTAINGGARFIVTFDEDLLSIEEHQGIKIITPGDFYEILKKRG